MDKRAAADFLDGILREQKIEKYSLFLNQSEKQELNLENGGFKLMRTVFNNTASVKVFMGAKMGSAGGNDMTEEGAGVRCSPERAFRVLRVFRGLAGREPFAYGAVHAPCFRVRIFLRTI